MAPKRKANPDDDGEWKSRQPQSVLRLKAVSSDDSEAMAEAIKPSHVTARLSGTRAWTDALISPALKCRDDKVRPYLVYICAVDLLRVCHRLPRPEDLPPPLRCLRYPETTRPDGCSARRRGAVLDVCHHRRLAPQLDSVLVDPRP